MAICSLTAITVRAQQKVIVDFEQVSPEACWGWDEPPEAVANPFKNGIDTSDQVLQWKRSAGSWKAFALSFDGVDISKNPIVSFKFYSPVKGKISARIETGKEGETIFFDLEITEINKWVKYTTDMTRLLKTVKVFTQASFFVNPTNEADTNTYYLDDMIAKQKK